MEIYFYTNKKKNRSNFSFCSNVKKKLLNISLKCILSGVKMSDTNVILSIGIAIGFIIGLNIGILIGKKQKPWSELTDEEKRHRKVLIGSGVVILVFGVIAGLWQYLTF